MMTQHPGHEKLDIRVLEHKHEARVCAELMANSEPWITLGRTYEKSLRLLQDPSREAYVAYHGETIVGFVLLVMNIAFRGYIQSLAVMPDWRNQKIGSQLLEFAEKRIFQETPNVFLCVSSFNPDAERLYTRLGYETIGELKDYIVAGHSEFLLRKTIGPLAEFTPQTV